MGKQELRSLALGAACLALATGVFGFTSPKDGGPVPDSYFRTKEKNAQAFTVKHAWAQKAARLRAARQTYLAATGNLQSLQAGQFAVADTLRVPVLPGFYFGESYSVSAVNLQAQLFSGNATGTVTDYYHEVSYNQLTVTGDVYPWTALTKDFGSYVGTCNGVQPGCSQTGLFIKDILDAKDASVNFAKYDNDGPDGIPNSGDDDGFVDAVVFLHNRPGGECDILSSNVISHTWQYSAWPNSLEQPYTTGDARTGGGFIQVDEYIIAPSVNCGATAPYSASEYIDIGVLCHELGHTMGLPDLYDVNGGGTGIGHWGIMGSGNWNTPEKPAHMDAWCKQELGWITPTVIDWHATPVTIPDAEESPVAYRLPFTDERFRRSTSCNIAGSYSLYCGLTAAEAATRGYSSPGTGYGSNWIQTIERNFHFSGAGAVALKYKYTYDIEPNYDFAEVAVVVDGVETQVASYTGTGSGAVNLPLGGLLAPLAGTGGDYTVRFRVLTDISYDDSDGIDPSTCGAFAVDDVSVTGGGEAYATDFETSVDGWHQNAAQTRSDEYWLVENRRKVGFDVNLHGEGLLIWHVDDEVLHAPMLLNRGNAGAVRGLVLEEAEGVFDLNDPGNNSGEVGDVYPGSSGHTSFDSGTIPNSNDDLARPTQIQVTGISAAGATMSATMRAGDPAPQANSVLPGDIDNDQPAVVVTVSGARIRYGATFRFVFSFTGAQTSSPSVVQDGSDMVPASLEWVDENTLRGTVNAYARTPGKWNLVVENPDGQTVDLDYALTIHSIVSTRLVSANVDVINAGVRLRYILLERDPGETIRLYRAAGGSSDFDLLDDNLEPTHGNDEYTYLDRSVEAGRSYTYLLESHTADGDVRELHRAVAVVPSRELVLEQNAPNPFNPRTSIRFYLPARTDVHLDVYDVKGALVRRLAQGTYDSGAHSVDWDGTDASGQGVASGFYVYRLVTDGHSTLTRKMMLLK